MRAGRRAIGAGFVNRLWLAKGARLAMPSRINRSGHWFACLTEVVAFVTRWFVT